MSMVFRQIESLDGHFRVRCLPHIVIFSTVFYLSSCADSTNLINNAESEMQSPNNISDADTPIPGELGNTDPSMNSPDSNTTATSARYRLTFSAIWSKESHPQNFPSNPHFSGLIGAVHNEQVVFWEPGQIATPGIQQVAETGGKSTLLTEIQTAIDNGSANSILNGGGIATSPGSISLEFEVNRLYPQISVVSMLAPSPDWFIGLHNYSLLKNGQFIMSAVIDIPLYDSGSDSGLQYQSSNVATIPLSPIALVTSDAEDTRFENGQPFVGRLLLEQLSIE